MGWRVFYSYAHEDEELRKKLGEFLDPLRRRNKITEWHDRMLDPGAPWDKEIRDEISQANLILFLLSSEFLASDYSFEVEVDKAFDLAKAGAAILVPVLVKPCLWEESRFSDLQIIPRDNRSVCSSDDPRSASLELLHEVAAAISKMVAEEPPQPRSRSSETTDTQKFDNSLELVRHQVRSYARIYERTRQHMPASEARRRRMEAIMTSMRNLATASYPLLEELAASPSPGERLAAVSILQVFASERQLQFLLSLVKGENPFVVFHALNALHVAVNSLDPQSYRALSQTIKDAKEALGGLGDSHRRSKELAAAERELGENIKAMSPTT